MANKRFPTDLTNKASVDNNDNLLLADSADGNKSKRVLASVLSAKILADGYVNDRALKVNVLEKDNTTAYTPSDDYNPTTKLYVDTLVEPITAHQADTDNPHNVTQTQVGLGNVDNTSDIDKPVSTAQKAAIFNGIVATETVSGSYVVDLDSYNSFSLIVSGDVFMGNPTTETVMGNGLISLRQDGTGGHSITFDTNWVFPTGVPIINTTANAWNIFRYTVLGTNVILAEYLADFVLMIEH